MTTRIPPTEWEAIAARRASGQSVSFIARSYDTSPATIYNILKKVAPASDAGGAQDAASDPDLESAPTPVAEAEPVLPVPELAESVAKVLAAPVEPAVRAVAPQPADRPQREEGRDPSVRPFGADRNGGGQPHRQGPPRERDQRPPFQPRQGQSHQGQPNQGQPHQGQSRQGQPHPGQSGGQHQPAHVNHGQANQAYAPAPQPSALEPIAVPPPPRLPIQRELPPALTADLDGELQAQANAALAAFQAAFEQVLAAETPAARQDLRQSASELMRIGARTIIVVDRRETAVARANAPAQRHGGGQGADRSEGGRNDGPRNEGFRQGRRPPR